MLLDRADIGVGAEEDVLKLCFLLVGFFDGFSGGDVFDSAGLERLLGGHVERGTDKEILGFGRDEMGEIREFDEERRDFEI